VVRSRDFLNGQRLVQVERITDFTVSELPSHSQLGRWGTNHDILRARRSPLLIQDEAG